MKIKQKEWNIKQRIGRGISTYQFTEIYDIILPRKRVKLMLIPHPIQIQKKYEYDITHTKIFSVNQY